MLEKTDKLLTDLLGLACAEMEKAKVRGYFSKDFSEAIGVVISLCYGRWSDNDK